ncbi:MAG: yyaC [Bacillales bacterium]|jgi:putative sporulation protein YyaC|nr:yyaC [Bacillales bacterium]
MFKKQEFSKLTDVAGVSNAIKKIVPKGYTNDDVVFVCVGSDRSTGDSLGPYVGTQLQKMGYTNVYGTLIDPVHAMTLEETLEKLPTNKYVIAIDACLGQVSSVGTIFMREEPLKPGAGVDKELPPVGDCAICGVVNVSGFMEYFVLQNTRLSLVIGMAETIVDAISEALPTIQRRQFYFKH